MPSEALLDNPIWNALLTEHASLAEGDHHARRYPPAIGPLAGIRDQSAESWESLRPLAGEYPVVLFSLEPIRPPQGWTTLRTGQVVQMLAAGKASHPHFYLPSIKTVVSLQPMPKVHTKSPRRPGAVSSQTTPVAPVTPDHKPLPVTGETGTITSDPTSGTTTISPADTTYHKPVPVTGELRQLNPADAPAMVELAQLTEPGPFRLRTIELGNFYGIFHGAQLVAMAGKRMHLPGLIEVSGVCTHPDARGRGYARWLIQIIMNEIEQAGCRPFLHAWADNPAVRLYQSIGFTLSRTFNLAVLAAQ